MAGRGNGRSSASTKRKREEFDDYEIVDPDEIDEGPDAMLVVPVVKVEELDIEVDDLRAAISLRASSRIWSSSTSGSAPSSARSS